MKSILKTFNAGFISNIALIGIVSVLTSACGSDADSNDPRRFDTTGPEITLNTRPEGDGVYAIGAIVELDINQEYVELGAEVRDVWDINNLVDQDPSTEGVQPILIEGVIDNTTPNDYTITYTATDSSGNSNSKTRLIKVADRSGPVITITGPSSITLASGGTFEPPIANAYDSFDDETTLVTDIDNQVNPSVTGTYSVIYSASDIAGNESQATLTVIVEPDYQDEIVVFQNGSLNGSWVQNGYDVDLNWGACPTGNCPNLDFGMENDPEKGRDVMYIDHGMDNDAQAGFFLDSSSSPIDLRGATVNGKLSFEVWSDSPEGVSLNVAVDCPTYPNAGSPVLLEGVGAQKWEEISIPAASLFNESCALRNDQIGTIPMFLSRWMGPKIRIDNIVWKCEFSCDGSNIADKEYTPWVKVDKTVGFGNNTSATYTKKTFDDEGQIISEEPYELVWSDEFDELDLGKWNLIDAGGGFGNSELQYYRPENASVTDGLLEISAEIQQSGDPDLPNGESFSSAKLTTQDKFEFKHGRVDIRAAVAEGKGMWSAGWMLGANVDDIGWPFAGEIDIVETIGGNHFGVDQENRMVHNAYWNATGPNAPEQGTVNYQRSSYSPTPDGNQKAWGERVIGEDIPENTAGETFSNTFHVFSIEWDEEKIRYMIDGEYVDGKDLDLNAGSSCDYGQQANEPELTCLGQSFNHDFFLILNVAVGGTFPGAPDDTTQFPRGMLVDYVRVYQTAAQQGVAD